MRKQTRKFKKNKQDKKKKSQRKTKGNKKINRGGGNKINYIISSHGSELESEFTTAEKRILDLRKQFNSYKENSKIATDVLSGELEKLVKQLLLLLLNF